MKIGILTVHDSANFGSYLQAYALWKFLTEQGYEVYFVRTRTRERVRQLYLGGKRNIIRYLSQYSYNIKKYNIMIPEINGFPEIALCDVEKVALDLVIIGSDELWNVNTPIFRNEYFYGIGVGAKRKITYAISCGSATLDKMKEYPQLVEGMKQLDVVMVRDELTFGNVKNLIGILPEKVCDPTLLVDKKIFETVYDVPIKEKYILVYGYAWDKELIRFIKRYAKEKQLKIVSVCMHQKWCDENIMCTPLQFGTLLKNAECVVTATFHGSIFSVLNHTRFLVCSKLPKVKNILEQMGVEERILVSRDYKSFVQTLEKKIDYKVVDEKIEELRRRSKKTFVGVLDSINATLY